MVNNLILSLRIPDWIKNSFIFAALIFSEHLFETSYIIKTVAAFFLFSLLSSAGYLINDIIDIQEDKKHPTKNSRPIASGKLPIKIALSTSIILLITSLSLGFLLNRNFGIILIFYFTFEILYCFFLKQKVILDVFGIAGGFILRVIAGGIVINVEISHWLLICTGLMSLFLGFSKRRHELTILGETAHQHRKVLLEYSPYFLDQMISISTTSTLIAYILYTISPETIQKFNTDKLILTTPFVLYGIFRYLYLIHKKGQGGSPTKLLLTDFPLLVDIVMWIFVSIIIIYYT
jgi:4-hydroxybenzoate polyprenyltransferase